MRILPSEVKMDKKDIGPAEAAWEMFEKTGNISYYLLYKKLK